MRRHRRFEFLAGEYLKQEGFQTEVTQGTADWGVDVFAEKDGIKYVVQAKMYGDCKTKINRSMMMELYGVMHYFDCQGAILIYNGGMMDNAKQVAKKLGIRLVYLDQHQLEQFLPETDTTFSDDVFSTIWDEIHQLEGQIIHKSPDTFYHIIKVTDGDITYTNRGGKRHREPAEIFRRITSRIWNLGSIEQCQMRGEYGTKASAFITTVFANIPSCKVTPKPYTIRPTKKFSGSDH